MRSNSSKSLAAMPIADDEPYCTIDLVRHGETDWNLKGLIQSSTDLSLNSRGAQQVKQLADWLKPHVWSAAFSSDLLRTRQTAKILLEGRGIECVESPLLRDGEVGSWEGAWVGPFLSGFRAWKASVTSKEQLFNERWHREVESCGEIYQRFENFILKFALEHVGSRLLVCSHGGVFITLLHVLTALEEKEEPSGIYQGQWRIDNAAYIELRVYPSRIHSRLSSCMQSLTEDKDRQLKLKSRAKPEWDRPFIERISTRGIWHTD